MLPKVFANLSWSRIVVLGLCKIWKISVTISHTIREGRRTWKIKN